MPLKGPVRTRFAPSPTGYMHVGGVRTALFAWLIARQARGQFLLRIEDTDRRRHVPEAEQHILESLKWLGLDWDEEIYRQSEHLENYQQWAKKLIDKGRAYADSRTTEEIDELRTKAKNGKYAFLIREHRPKNPPTWDATQPLRFKSEPKPYHWQDEVMGKMSAGPEAIDDFILIKSDGYPTYDFAHIVDDQTMAISHVMRSQEFASSVPKYLNLYEALGVEAPKLAMLPYVLAPDGRKKLSKRDGAKEVLHYKQSGFLSEAMLNFLATLGWNDGTEQEIFTRQELLAKFSLTRVQRSGANFDEQRLLWMNGHYLRQLPLNELSRQAEAFWPKSAESADKKYKSRVLELVQERLKYLKELPVLTDFFFQEPTAEAVQKLYDSPVDRQLKNLKPGDRLELLSAVIKELEASTFSQPDIRVRLNNLLEKLDTKPGILFSAIRIAVTGSQVSPEIFGTLAVLGKQKSVERLKKAVSAT